jgi:haloacetate dehalogenase
VFESFTLEYLDVGEVTLRVRHGGDGHPVVLLHAIRGRIQRGIG